MDGAGGVSDLLHRGRDVEDACVQPRTGRFGLGLTWVLLTWLLGRKRCWGYVVERVAGVLVCGFASFYRSLLWLVLLFEYALRLFQLRLYP